MPGFPADSQPGESYNNDLQRSEVINKRQSRVRNNVSDWHHLADWWLIGASSGGIPQMLKLDGAFNQNVTMTLEPTGYASQYLSKAYTILTGQLAVVVCGDWMVLALVGCEFECVICCRFLCLLCLLCAYWLH